LGAPRSKGPSESKKRQQNNDNAFNKIIDIVGEWGDWGSTITVAWGLTRPKSGTDYMLL